MKPAQGEICPGRARADCWILASGSPRRRELLGLTGWQFHVRVVGVDEASIRGEAPEAYVRRVAAAKAQTAASLNLETTLILAADTIVVDDDRLLGKPADASEAMAMLMALRGRTHRVLTALVWIVPGRQSPLVEVCETEVPMRTYSEAQVRRYVESGSPFDKAGGYGIQDAGFQPVDIKALEGCFANVMGLPLCHLTRGMRALGNEPPEDVPMQCQAHTAYDCKVSERILKGAER